MCIKAVEDEPGALEYVPNHFKTKGMCIKAVENEPGTLKFVLDDFRLKRCVKELYTT